jgi:subtilisin family serine protease
MKQLILFLILAGITPGLFAQSDFFYSGNGNMNTLKIRKDRVIFNTKSTNSVNIMENRQNSRIKFTGSTALNWIKAEVDPETFSENDFAGIDSVTDWYYMLEDIDGGVLMALTNRIFVGPGTDKSIEEIIQESGLSDKVEKQELFFPEKGIYLLTLNCKMKDILSVCRQIYETGMVDIAEPDFYIEGVLGNTLWPNQWNLKNTGQEGGTPGIDIHVEPAWTVTRGSSSIKIAVVDEGVDLTHPDLQANLLAGYDATGSGSAGSYTAGSDDTHGTSCAGVIGAINNSIGVVGVASGCKMIPVKVFTGGGGRVSDATSGIGYARSAGADVINNSWGFIETTTTPSEPLKAAMIAEINSCVNSGRDGKGCVLVFCSHNDNGVNIRFPAYLDNVIAVGAISRTGQRLSYSNYGNAVDVVAPVGEDFPNDNSDTQIYTTDIQGSLGANKASGTTGDYRPNFRGTSAACPQVAGIAALILSVNSNLTAAEVRSIIGMTAQKLDGYVFQTTSAHPDGSWNNEVGYGLVDAQAAVQAATCKNGNTMIQTMSSNQFVRSCNDTFYIPGAVEVKNNAKLTIKAKEASINYGEFVVQSGSRFEIR